MKLSVLMTVYNEKDFVEYAIKSCLPFVDHLVIVEGAYQETIKLGKSPRSDDGTKEKIFDLLYYREGVSSKKATNHLAVNFFETDKVCYIEANEQTDKDQRNVGLKKIKELSPDGFLLIVDADEIYDPNTFSLIRSTMKMMRKNNKKMAYFNSLTFVNDAKHYTNQYFPRLFDLKNAVEFVNDNYMIWNENIEDWVLYGQGSSPIKYYHFAFTKGRERFELKKKWWETRFNKPFNYSWFIDENGKINDTDHKIFLYEGKFPDVLSNHPLVGKGENKNGDEK